jgi:hypothetical protein
MEPVMIPIGFFAMVAVISVGAMITRVYTRRLEHEGKTKVPSEVTSRLERIEQAVDAIAIEVERISEGQRFTTKLLTERAADANRLAEPRRPS